ncbi:MAG: cell surface protein SprA [Bacteroidetes bacterium]|nr:cell surface protein SprA [Bacteroidota bacterium]
MKLKSNITFQSTLFLLAIFITFIASFGDAHAQGRRGKDIVIITGNPLDSSFTSVLDSVDKARQDSIRKLPVDSTARIKYFKYIAPYTYGTKPNTTISPIILGNSEEIKYEVTFDSLNHVIVRQTFNGEDIKAPLVMSIDAYLKLLGEQKQRSIFNDIVSAKFQGNTQDDLSKLFEKITNITIPLPFKSETIFGPPTINLSINGIIDITASYQKITSEQTNTQVSDNTQNNINFKQDVQVTARGKVGDKLSIDADWNTTRTFDFENQLKLKYEGYADEVIQKIEAGNVSLDTRSSLIQSSQALFGIRGEFKLGPLTLTTVVSQKKSKQETKDFSSGSSQTSDNIAVYNYSDNHYFLDTAYKSNFVDFMEDGQLQSIENIARQVSNTNFEVWVQTQNTTADRKNASLLIDLPPLPPGANTNYRDSFYTPKQIPGHRYFGIFRKLSPTEYTVNYQAGFISLKTPVQDNDYIGVSYSTLGYGTIPSQTYGTNSNSYAQDTLVLKMVKAGSIVPQTDTLAWALKMKNIYRLNVSRIVEDGFEFKVNYVDPSNPTPSPSLPNGKSLLEVTGLDRFIGKGPQLGQDNNFDFLQGRTVNTETGDIIFPTLEPFNQPILTATGDTSLVFRDIYTKLKSEAGIAPNNSKYILSYKARGEAGVNSTINLGFNVVEGSVTVKVGETPLVLNQDYSVDYTTGTVTIKNAAALQSKDLKISYEQNELFSLASKTFIGARGDYKISDKTSLGFTYVNLKQETLNDKVRIGEEPTNNSMFGVDFTTEIKSKFLTKVVNTLPGFNSKEESGFTFKGEFAMITGDPNTKKSQIPSDNNESVAYVDDMEGSKKIISMGSNYSSWTVSSIPATYKNTSNISLPDSVTRKFQPFRGRMRWYNIPNDVSIKDIYPLRDVAAGQDRITPFYITYDPNNRGQYNYNLKYNNPDFGDTMATHKAETFNGIMKYLNSTTTDLQSENINFIEFSMRVDSKVSLVGNQNAKLNIDLGLISEDAIPNGILNTEDKNNNGTLEVDEDIGLDMLPDSLEVRQYPGLGGDPSLDDNANGNINYDVINGTEGNRFYDGGNKPDTEDLNKNGTLDSYDSYRSYSISLDTVNNSRIVGKGANGWAQYRIPLSEFTQNIGNGSLNNVQYVRIWVTGLTDTIRISLVDLNLVGNQWVKPNKGDTSYSISVVSIEENPQIYQSPVGGDILRQTIINQNSANTKSNEQSLSIDVRNLSTSGDRKYARKDYGSAPLDLFNYKRLKLFVNGDPTFNYTNENIYDAAMVVRFGTDSNNYYEYRAPVHPDVRPGQPWNSQNEVTINFTDLTAIKLARDSSGISQAFPVPNGPPGAYYIIKGNPALNIIREIVLGVEKNRSALNSTITGSTWFNEIRLLKVNDDNGYAYNFSAGLKLSDLMLMNLNFSKVDPNFHSIDARVGSRNTGQNWDLSATFNAHKLINNALVSLFGSDKWGNFLTLPITFRHSENLLKPKYFPGTDVDVTTASDQKYQQVLASTGNTQLAKDQSENLIFESQTLGVQNSINISGMQFNIPVDNYLVTHILNRFQFNLNANLNNSRDNTYSSQSQFNLTGGVAFATDFGLADKVNIHLGKLLPLGEKYKDAKLYFFFPFIGMAPLFTSNFNAGTDFSRTKNESQQRRLLNADATTRIFSANRNFGFDWKFIENWIVDMTGSYQFRVGSDLTGLETNPDSLRTQRFTNEIFGDIFFNNGVINFGKDLNYTQSVLMHPKFNFPVIDKFMTFNLDYNVTYGWTNPNTTQNIGYNVGFQNSVTSGANIKLSELFNIFKKGDTQPPGTTDPNGKFRIKSYLRSDSTTGGKTDPAELFKIFKTFFPDNITVSVTQTNQVFNTNISGIPGFANFWFYPTTNDKYGPSRMYQLGLNRDPGPRYPNVNNMSDSYNLSNDLQFSTTISPIFPEAIRMSVNFKTSWGNNTSRLFNTGPFGNDTGTTSVSNLRTKGYSTFFVGNVENFTVEGDSITGTVFADAIKSKLKGFAFPNWTLTITGLEKFPLFAQFAQSVTLDNSFQSEYSEGTSSDKTDITTVTNQRVVQSFNPLIGLNFNFKQLLGGNMTANFKYNKATSYIINPQSNLIQATNTSDWSINANFTKSGFDIPLFGLSLKNDISFALTIARTLNDPIDYVYPRGIRDKRPGAGSTQMTINPSVQYNLSSKVAMQLFYKYIKTEPTENTVAITPRTSNEGGLNIKITIQ